jgi:hypothetical protein
MKNGGMWMVIGLLCAAVASAADYKAPRTPALLSGKR